MCATVPGGHARDCLRALTTFPDQLPLPPDVPDRPLASRFNRETGLGLAQGLARLTAAVALG